MRASPDPARRPDAPEPGDEAGPGAQSAEFEHESTLPFVIVRLAGTLRQAFAEAMAPLDLTPPLFGVLAQFSDEEPTTAAAIARVSGLSPQAIGPHIDALVARGLITRTPRPGRGRPNELRLTPEGVTTRRRAIEIARAERDRVTGQLSPVQRRTMLTQLREIDRRARGRPGD